MSKVTNKIPYLIDTSALGALILSSEESHEHYMRTMDELFERLDLSVITTDYIIDEWFTMLRCKHKLPVIDILRLLNEIRPYIVIKPITSDVVDSTFEILKKYSDHFLSFTDASTVALMKKEKIHHILTSDHDFQIFGFSIL